MTRKKAERQDTLSMNILRLSQEIKRLSLSSVFRRDEVRYLKKKKQSCFATQSKDCEYYVQLHLFHAWVVRQTSFCFDLFLWVLHRLAFTSTCCGRSQGEILILNHSAYSSQKGEHFWKESHRHSSKSPSQILPFLRASSSHPCHLGCGNFCSILVTCLLVICAP